MSFSISKSLDLFQFSGSSADPNDPLSGNPRRRSPHLSLMPLAQTCVAGRAQDTRRSKWKSHKKINGSKETDRNSGTIKTQHHWVSQMATFDAVAQIPWRQGPAGSSHLQVDIFQRDSLHLWRWNWLHALQVPGCTWALKCLRIPTKSQGAKAKASFANPWFHHVRPKTSAKLQAQNLSFAKIPEKLPETRGVIGFAESCLFL